MKRNQEHSANPSAKRDGGKSSFNMLVENLRIKTQLQIRLQDDVESMDDCCHSCYRLGKNEVLHQRRVERCPEGKWPNQDKVLSS